MICVNKQSISENQQVIGWVCNSITNSILFPNYFDLLNQEWLTIDVINYWKEQRIYFENISIYIEFLGQKTKDTNHIYFYF